ncbi:MULTISPECIES: RDD family protein [Niastella]|uniref:RDD family protein n=1 Tax=Niastella soli TaxID=2821487 RepID=A0ABS3YVC7_9BACT|nr:RDD family protein [Niastella soli]MBO9201833.1 RDD family protein [Niastella soli]
MLLVKLDTGFNIEVEFALSPFHRRFFAWLIDATIQGTYLYMGGKILSGLIGENWNDETYRVVLYVLPFIFYHLISEILMNGQSVGKMAMQIKVMTIQGGEPSISQYLIRWLFRIIDFPILLFLGSFSGYSTWWVVLFLFAGLICVIATPKSQRVGDLVAGTILIDLKKRTSWQDTVFTEVESTYQPRYPQVMQLTDRDINTLKNIIETVKRRNDYDLSLKIAYRIQSKLKMTSDQDSLEFLQTLLKDYNYYSTN